MLVQTTTTRIEKLKKILAGTGISVALLVGGVAGDYYVNPRIVMEGGAVEMESLTPNEYAQLRTPEGNIVSKLARYRTGQDLPLQDVALIEAVLTLEVNDCGGIYLKGLTRENYQEVRWDWLWNRLTNNKCK